jgi:hypothetical protein
MCIATAITANAPIISATILGGVAAIKVSQRDKRRKPSITEKEILVPIENEEEDEYIDHKKHGYFRRK